MELHPFNDRNLIQLHLGCRPTSPQSINVTTPQSDRSIRISPRPISIIERLVAAHAIEVSQNLFSWMDPPSLISLGRTSRIMNGAVRIYSKKSWKIGELFAQFVDRKSIAAFRTLLMLSRALVFGPAALMFFDRMHRYCIRLDVAVPLNAIRDFVHFLALEGYSIQGGIPSFIHKLKSRMHPRTISGCGDRHMAERDRTRADIFVFTKKDRRLGSGDTKHVILVHLIQSEAYQYVLAQHSSPLMCFISHATAVSLFPLTTFGKRQSLVSRNEFLESDDTILSTWKWLQHYMCAANIESVGLVTHLVERAEIGRRYIGDSLSWVVHFNDQSSEVFAEFAEYPAFDVMDWTSTATALDSYMRVSEPFIWRQWSDLRINAGTQFQ